MKEKTKLIFKDEVINGYKHYYRFKSDFQRALDTFTKYVLPIPLDYSFDVDNDWLIFDVDKDWLIFYSTSNDEDGLKEIQKEIKECLNEEGINYSYIYDDGCLIITIDEFVEWVLKKY